MDEKEKQENTPEEQPEKGVRAKWGALWIFVFVIALYFLLDYFVLTPLINWIRK